MMLEKFVELSDHLISFKTILNSTKLNAKILATSLALKSPK